GTHTLVLSNTNTYSGGTTINSGATLNVTGSIEGPATVNGTFDVNNSFTIGDLNGGTSGAIILGSGDTLSVAGNSLDTFAGTVSGMGGLTISGDSNLILSGTLTYTGKTTIDADNTLTLSGTGDNIGAVVDNGTLNIDPNVSITDLNGSGILDFFTSDILTVNTTMADTFSGEISGSGGFGVTVDGTDGGSLALTGNLSDYSGTFTLTMQHNGMLDISGAEGTADYDEVNAGYPNDYWVNFIQMDIVFGAGGGTLTVGAGRAPGGTLGTNLGEELSGSISLTGSGITGTIKSNSGSGYSTLISGPINNTNAGNTLLLQNSAGSTGTFIFGNDSNATDFTAGTLRLGLHGSAPTELVFNAQNQNYYGNAGYLPGPNVTIVLDGGWLSSDGSFGFTVTNNIKLTDHQGGIISGGYGEGGYFDPVDYSGTISGLYGSGGKLTLQNDGNGYYENVELSGNNTFSDGTTIGVTGGYIEGMAGSNTAFGTGELVLGTQGSLGTINDIDGDVGGTPIHIMVSGFDSSA
ncbi:MAG TPA: hypothetical protein VKJ65_05805, partial [Phycisphaerae bacterium]|nr:hypothetical protein [Phycisphaerae bacterium]